MKIKILNELAPAPAPAPAPAAQPTVTQTTTAAETPTQQNQPHPIDPTLIPIIQKQFFDAFNPSTNAVLKAAITKTINDVLSKVLIK